MPALVGPLQRPQTYLPVRRSGGVWSMLTHGALGIVETIVLLPVLLAWWLLYRWSPDPP
jgi:hypothetical protein